MQGHYVSGLQCNVITWEQTKKIFLKKRYRKHKLYNRMLTRLVRQCSKQVAGQRPKPSPHPLLNLHFPLFSAFLSPPFPIKKRESISCISKDWSLLDQHNKNLITIVFFSLVTTYLLLFSCTLHRLCISLLSRGRLLCIACKHSLSHLRKYIFYLSVIKTRFM